MDSLTHLCLGACTGELILGRKLGKKAMLWGAIAANIPDVDTVAGFFVSADKSLLIHRGITHSLFFALVAGLLLALLASKIRPKIGFRWLFFFFCFQLALHDLLDTCTSYGTGLLEPFGHQRFSVHLIYVADPLFTISLLIASIYLIRGIKFRAAWAVTGLAISGLYLCFAVFCKISTNFNVNASLTTPAPFTSILWYCIVKTDSGYYTGYHSVFDRKHIEYTWHPKNDSLLKTPQPNLKTFANGYYTLSKFNDTLYFNVLRFGEIQGWQTKDARFALSYPVNVNDNNDMIVQKGRLTGWNKKSILLYIERIAGR